MAEISLKLARQVVYETEARLQAYAALLAGLSVIVFTGLAATGYDLGDPWAVGALCVAAALAQRGQVDVSGALKVSISLFPILLAAVLFGPLAAMMVSVASMLGEERRPLTRWVCYASSRSLTGAVAGLIAIELSHSTLPSILAASAAAAICTQVLDFAFAAFAFTLRGHGSPLTVVRTLGPFHFHIDASVRPWSCAACSRAMRPSHPGFSPCSLLRLLRRRSHSSSTRRKGSSQSIWRTRTFSSSGQTSRLPQLWWLPSTPEIATQLVTPRRWRYMPGISRHAWGSLLKRCNWHTYADLFTTSERSVFLLDS